MNGDHDEMEGGRVGSTTFHLDDGRYLVLTVARTRTTAFGFDDNVHKTRLELYSADRVLLRRANLAPMLREDPR